MSERHVHYQSVTGADQTCAPECPDCLAREKRLSALEGEREADDKAYEALKGAYQAAAKERDAALAQVETLRGKIRKAPVKVWLCSQHGAIVGEDRSRCACATRTPLIEQNAALAGAEGKP